MTRPAMPGKPLRVTQVVFDLEGGGLESVVAALARGFKDSTIRMSIITLSGREGRVGASLRDAIETIIPHRPLRGVSMLLPIGLSRAIASTRPDVVHLHSGAWFKPALAARLAAVRNTIYTEHGREHDDTGFARWLDRRASDLTARVVAVSPRLKAYLVNAVKIRTPISVIRNGVDTARFSPGDKAEARAALGLPPEAFIAGSVGRLEAVKAYPRLIEAFAAIQGRAGDRPLVLLIAGEGSARGALEAQARSLGVAPQVRFPGWVDPVNVYRALDVFSLTSISEGMSMSLLEAMSCAALPAVMDVGANAELLGPALASQVVSAGDTAAIAELLVKAVAEPALRRQLAMRARERVIGHYSIQRMLASYERVYRGERVEDA